MEKVKFYKIVIVVLIVINLATLSSIWFLKPNHHRSLPHDRGMSFLANELGVNGSDKQKLDAMELNHHSEKRELLEKNKQLREKLFGLLKHNDGDSIKVNKYVDSILLNQRHIELMTYYHFRDVKSMCSPEQQIKLEEIIKEAIKMAGGKPPKK